MIHRPLKLELAPAMSIKTSACYPPCMAVTHGGSAFMPACPSSGWPGGLFEGSCLRFAPRAPCLLVSSWHSSTGRHMHGLFKTMQCTVSAWIQACSMHRLAFLLLSGRPAKAVQPLKEWRVSVNGVSLLHQTCRLQLGCSCDNSCLPGCPDCCCSGGPAPSPSR